MPYIFEIKHAIANHTQGTYSLATYYTILKSYWDELSSCDSNTTCTCGAFNTYIDLLHRDWLIEFLMGLDGTCNKIPLVNKAYALLLYDKLNILFTMPHQQTEQLPWLLLIPTNPSSMAKIHHTIVTIVVKMVTTSLGVD